MNHQNPDETDPLAPELPNHLWESEPQSDGTRLPDGITAPYWEAEPGVIVVSGAKDP